MRALIASDGTWGDVGPLLTVARDLARECGHEVLAIVNPVFADAAEQLGLSYLTAGESWWYSFATAPFFPSNTSLTKASILYTLYSILYTARYGYHWL